MKKISIFPRYNTLGASSRYRFYMYAERLVKAGYEVRISSFLDNDYLTRLYSNRRVNPFMILRSYIRRLYKALFSAKCILLEYEMFPYLPFFFSKLFLAGKKYILNFDDNVWTKYSGKPWLKGKYDRLIKNAAGVIAANEYLYEIIKKHNGNIIRIPTVIDLDLYQAEYPKFERFTIIWIGTPVTYKYVLQFAGAFRQMAGELDFELLILSSTALEKDRIPGVNMRFVDWHPAIEAEYLIRSHIGVMPLTDDDFSRGKSAFKIIQYLAAGLPVIASPVGENRNVIADGENGFLADSPDEWADVLRKLYRDHELYSKVAAAARKSSSDYSIQKYFPVFLNFMEKTFS
ncbi:MAG: glycosyltransferase family 4 protein [Lentisphaerota bacterium]